MRRMFPLIPAVVLACATGSSNPQKSATRQAQEDAQQQYQKAASAQKQAGEEQQKAEQAERDVTKARTVLADAQARLVAQRAKAAQAQRDAIQLGRESQERGAQMQEQATQLQGQEARQRADAERANQQAGKQTWNVSGAVAAVSPTSLTVRSDDRVDVQLEVSDFTAVNLDGRSASMREIRAGSDVRASYGVVDGRTMAMRLDVTSKNSIENSQRQ